MSKAAKIALVVVAAVFGGLALRVYAFVIVPEQRWTVYVMAIILAELILLLLVILFASEGLPSVYRLALPQQAREPIYQWVASVFGWWAKMRLGRSLGPGLGLITERLRDLDLSAALPAQRPPAELIDGAARSLASDSGPTPELRTANVWAAALEAHLLRVRGSSPPRAVLTTYGFVRTDAGVRLAVIHYLRPWAAFAAVRQQPIEIMGWSFPVIIRPWLPTRHGSTSRFDGNCWVKFLDDAGRRQPGILTARHALKPKGAKPRKRVRADVSRPAPRGSLYYQSGVMDAAVVAVEEREWGKKVLARHSTVVGYKPVRLVTGHGSVDADIVAHSGFTGATIPGLAGREPLNPVYMFLNKGLEHGDSGCLVLDLEFAPDRSSRPYLIYLGVENLKLGGVQGYGLLIEQANRVWNLECYMDDNP